MSQIQSGFVIRRIPPGLPGFDTVIGEGDSRRPTSASLGLREEEDGLSCSLLSITSPEALLKHIGQSYLTGWNVAQWKIEDIADDFNVFIKETDEDPGHCIITPKDGQNFKKSLQKKLAKKAKLLAP